MIPVKVVNTSTRDLPKYETEGSAGMDLAADTSVVLKPFERYLMPTGLYIELPTGYEAQVRPRSGLSLNRGITLVNCVGTIDSDYRGEVCVPLINLSNQEQTILAGTRIAQLVFSRYEQAEWVVSESLEESARGAGGFGSTGV